MNVLQFDAHNQSHRDHAMKVGVSKGLVKEFYCGMFSCGFVKPQFTIPKLYRYTKKEYGFDKGSIRLNTLFNFQRGEGLNDAQRDLAEGLLTVVARDRDGYLQTAEIVSLDVWTLCFSSVLSKNMMEKFEADVVYEISPRQFIYKLSSAMAPVSDCSAIYKVRYPNPTEFNISNQAASHDYDLRVDPRFFAREVKSQRFSYQSEYRICFEPRARPYENFLVRKDNGLGRYPTVGFSDGQELAVETQPRRYLNPHSSSTVIAGLLPYHHINLPSLSNYIKEVSVDALR